MTIQQAYQQLLVQLYEIYEQQEAVNIVDWVIEHITGFRKIDRIINKQFPLNEQQQQLFININAQLLQHKPIQYVLGEAYFAGMKLFVDENVLIPRPETEELVEWVVEEVRGIKDKGQMTNDEVKSEKLYLENLNLSIIDIGTGSGCIPIAIKKKVPGADVSAVEVSEGALKVAKRNAQEQRTSIKYLQLDFLDAAEWNKLTTFDIIVSNPPYVKQSEEALMEKNVLDYEPHLALFIPDGDALIFYRKIAHFAKHHLVPDGSIFLEINEALGNDVEKLFKDLSFSSTEIKKDMQGKDRMVKVKK